jgi:glutamate carboxypeptidase
MSDDLQTLLREDRIMLDRLAARQDELVSRAIGWALVNSGSANLAGLHTVAGLLGDALAKLPGELEQIPLASVTRIDSGGAEQELAQGHSLRLTVRPGAPFQVALTGHYDTVFPQETTFTTVMTQPDGTLNGPGIADMKGGISVMLAALEAIEQHPFGSRLGYRVLLSPDEETGSLASAPLLAELAQDAMVGLTFEPALADGTLVSARKGSGNYHVVVEGRSAHAGRDFASGRNAVAAAARIAAALDGLNGQRDVVTVNIARIDGGSALNVVPDRAVLRFNVRLPDDDALAWLQHGIEQALQLVNEAGMRVSLHGGVNRPPKPFTAGQQTLFERLRRIGALIGLPLAWKPSGGVCEGNNLFAHGLPCVDTLGVRGGAIHSHEEFAVPGSFPERAQLSALILARIPYIVQSREAP